MAILLKGPTILVTKQDKQKGKSWSNKDMMQFASME